MENGIKDFIRNTVLQVAEENQLSLPPFAEQTELVDEMGFSSLTIAMLLFKLELELGVDPFLSEDVTIADIRTYGDLCSVYMNCVEQQH